MLVCAWLSSDSLLRFLGRSDPQGTLPGIVCIVRIVVIGERLTLSVARGRCVWISQWLFRSSESRKVTALKPRVHHQNYIKLQKMIMISFRNCDIMMSYPPESRGLPAVPANIRESDVHCSYERWRKGGETYSTRPGWVCPARPRLTASHQLTVLKIGTVRTFQALSACDTDLVQESATATSSSLGSRRHAGVKITL